jgi:carbon-monoxide dehydrogenase medium subunit
MAIAAFSYHDPTSVPEALELLEKLEDAKPLAGGQSLVPYLFIRTQCHRHLIDLTNIAEVCPILQDALHVLGHQATRTRGTIGGSLSNMDPSADLFGVSALTRPSDPISEIKSICATLRDSPGAIRAASP